MTPNRDDTGLTVENDDIPMVGSSASLDDALELRSEMIAAISSTVGRLVREYTGRGPTRIRTRITRDEVFIVMEDMLTSGERTLVAAGQMDRVKDLRAAYQGALRDSLIKCVEQAVGRKVVAFLSDDHLEPDIAVEVFVLGEQI